MQELREKAITRYVDLNVPKVIGERLHSYLHTFSEHYAHDGKSVAFKPDYAKATMRRNLQSQSARDTAGGMAYVKQRVQKHFQGWQAIWRVVLEEMRVLFERYKEAIVVVYGEEMAGECACLSVSDV